MPLQHADPAVKWVSATSPMVDISPKAKVEYAVLANQVRTLEELFDSLSGLSPLYFAARLENLDGALGPLSYGLIGDMDERTKAETVLPAATDLLLAAGDQRDCFDTLHNFR